MQSSVVDVPGDAGRVEVRHAGGGGGRDGGGGGRTVRPSAAGEQRHECVQGPLLEGHHSARCQSSSNVLSKIVLAVNHSSTCFVASFFLPLTLAKTASSSSSFGGSSLLRMRGRSASCRRETRSNPRTDGRRDVRTEDRAPLGNTPRSRFCVATADHRADDKRRRPL